MNKFMREHNLSEAIELPKEEIVLNDGEKAKDIEPVELEINNGEEKLPDAIKKKEDDEKEEEKELKVAAEVVDDINTADTPEIKLQDGNGKVVKKLSPVKEKLILEEPSDMLNEGFEDVDANNKIDMLLGDFGVDPLDLIAYVVDWLPHDDLDRLVNNFIVDNDLEDEFEFINEEFPRLGPLEEAIPHDLVKGYKRSRYAGKPNADLHNATYDKISKEDAYKLIRNGGADKLRLVIDGKFVAVKDNGYGDITYRNKYVDRDKAYTKRAGGKVYDTAYMPAMHLLSIADSVYVTNEGEPEGKKSAELLRQRSENPESPNYSGEFNRWPDVGDRYFGRGIRGNREVPNSKGNAQDAQYYRKKIAYYENEVKQLKADYEKGNIDKDEYDRRRSSYVGYIRDYQKAIGDDYDNKARTRYVSAENKLREPMKAFKELRIRVKDEQSRVEDAKSDLDDIKNYGSAETRRDREKYQDLLRELKAINRQISVYELKLSDADELDAKALEAAEEAYKSCNTRYEEAKKEIDNFFARRKAANA